MFLISADAAARRPGSLEEQLQAPSAASDEGPAVDAASPPVAKSTVDLPDLGVGL